MIGQTISHYHIKEKLGEGGMGVVYVAEDTHLKRRVALKFLSSLDHPYRARFLREAQAVSRLTHPNVATVFDYGETPSGQPFIVMELVEGKTLQDVLLDDSLPMIEAVRITAFIGEALAEAHRMGIVHRDVKPSNVVIKTRGHVKVLDFGLAKLLDEEAVGDDATKVVSLLATRTKSSVVVGTPLYLSPEQAMGKPIDGRSDLFALGAVLYECLSGRSAFSGGSAIEIGAQVIHFTPPPPSSLNPHVTAELDRITMKALEKNTAQRYQTAAEFVNDLRQVEATLSNDGYRPPRVSIPSAVSRVTHPSAITTIAEAIRRPRLSLAVVVPVILASGLLVWGIAKWWKPPPYKASDTGQHWFDEGTDALRNGAYLQASIALERAITSDPEFALAHARLAEALVELDNLDRAKDELLLVHSLDPARLRRIDKLYVDAIHNVVSRNFSAAANHYAEIVSLAPNDARAYVDLGRAYERNQEMDRAIENYRKATSLDSEYPTAYLRVGSCYSRKGDVASAGSALEKAEVLFRALANTEGVAEVSRERGLLLARDGKYAEAKTQFEQTLATARATNNDSQAVIALLELSYLSFTRGSFDDAQNYAQQAVDHAQQKHFENFVTAGLIELGNLYRGRGDYKKAETYFQQAIEIARVNKGRRREASALLNLGGLRIHQLRADEGLELVQQAYNFYQQAGYHLDVLICQTELGRGNRRKGNYAEALKILQQKLDLANQVGNKGQIAFAYADIGAVMIDQERYPEALANYDLSYNLNNALQNSIHIAYNQHNRANILMRLGQPERAREALQNAFEISSQRKNTYNALLPDIELSYASILLSKREFPGASKRAEKALQLAGSRFPAVSIEAKHVLGLARVFAGAGREGLRLCEEAASEAMKSGDEGLISRTHLALAEALLQSGEADRALQVANAVGDRTAQHEQHESEWRAWLIAAQASQKLGDTDSASLLFARAKKAYSQLEQQWGTEAFKSYLTRSDVQAYVSQLTTN